MRPNDSDRRRHLSELEAVPLTGGAVEIDYSVTGRRRREMPLSKDILSFGWRGRRAPRPSK